MEFKDLMKALADEAGFDAEIEGDDDGIYRIVYQDEPVCFQEVPQLHRLYISAKVGALPVEGADAFKTLLLKANYFGGDVAGGAFSLTEDDMVHFHTSLDLVGLEDQVAFLTVLESVLTVLDVWRKKIADFRPSAESAPSEEMYRPDGAFIQV